MSDEIVRHASNLCTSEDAFEQFQSNAMHQDDDFITLSDIVTPGPKVPDLASELNEVELSSNMDETSHVNNPPNANCVEIVQSELIPHTSSSTLVSTETTPHIEKAKNPKKRGRKKKIIQSPIGATPNSNISHDDTKQYEGPSAAEQDMVSRLDTIHTKRGRRVRQPNMLLKQDYVANKSRKANTETKRKRERPRKQQPDGTLQEADSTNHNNASSNEASVFEQTQNRSKKTKIKRKPKKTLKEATEQLNNDVSSSGVSYRDDDHLDDVALSELTSKASEKLDESSATFAAEQDSDKPECNDAVINCTETKRANANKQLNGVNDISHGKINKSPGKRKRQRKEIIMCIVKDQEKTDISIGDINKRDDESLSIIKHMLKDTGNKMEVNVEIPSQKTPLSPLPAPIGSESHDGSNKRIAKMPLMTDFEYNLDSVVRTTRETDKINDPNEIFDNGDLLIEDTSKRPSRSKARKILHYDDGSDEDPFANVELSDDDEPRRKGNKYYSDDEYVPHHAKNKRKAAIGTSSDSEDEMILGDQLLYPKRKSKKSDCNIPKKRGRKSKDIAVSGALSTQEVEDSDPAVQPTTNTNWGTSNEFESFIAKKIQGTNLKIKKLSSSNSSENALAPLAIPTISANAAKGKIDISCQTNRVSTVSTAIQTSNPHEVPLKENVTLTTEQSQEACKFLHSVVTTTAELGQLMTQKSEDFIKKKINSSHVVDTSTMDYCVKKSYLLFKLAKHNLLQMEEDLAKQYEEFLKTHNLSNCREEIKKLEPKLIIEDNDSDCEIVDVSPANPKEKKEKLKDKPKFNPKTVFLNKELSIKIAKKPTDTKKPQAEKNVNTEGRHTVWINDSIMVKKVTPNQSFLAEDSRNQKPPDRYVTEKMVSDFFISYERQKALAICSPFTTTEWKSLKQSYVCNYFVVQPNDAYDLNWLDNNNIDVNSMENSDAANNLDTNTNHSTQSAYSIELSSPKTLFTLCIQNMQKHLDMIQIIKKVDHDQPNKLTDHKINQERPLSLVGMCLGVLNSTSVPKPKYEDSILGSISTYVGTTLFPFHDSTPKCDSPDIGTPFFPCENSTSTPVEYISTHVGATVYSLKSLCYRVIVMLLYKETSSANENSEEDIVEYDVNTKENFDIIKPNEQNDSVKCYPHKNGFKTLFSLCLELIQSEQKERLEKKVSNNSHDSISEVNSLNHIAFEYIRKIVYENNTRCRPSDINDEIIPISIVDGIPTEGLTINAINTMSEEAFHNIEGVILDTHEDTHYSDNEESHCYEDELVPDDNVQDDAATEDNSWVSQVQMQEFRSCSVHDTENDNIELQQENVSMAMIKLEPLEETCDDILDTSVIVKREPINCFDEMINIPDDIITKTEILEQPGRILERVNSNSYDENLFETFVSSHKIIQGTHLETEGVFSQSALRVRRQFEPDCDEDNDTSMSLLVPQAFEPLHIEQAKGCLMESSSDDDASGKKTKGKKKIDKRKGKQKKTDIKTSNKDTVPNIKEKAGNEVSFLTKKMRERIRHEKKTINSSDSETDVPSNISGKAKKTTDKSKAPGNPNDENDEIQCNNVDSTEQIGEYVGRTNTPVAETFTGFSADDLVEVNSFEKYRKHIFETEKVTALAKESEDAKCANENEETLYSLDQPAELLECEPTLPVFEQSQKRRRKQLKENFNVQSKLKSDENSDSLNPVLSVEKQYTDRHGWQCYPVSSSDPKLYEIAIILLEKLPESFVETYLTYQEMIDKNEEDIEIDRLINLNSLNRIPNVKDPMTRNKGKDKSKPEGLAEVAPEDFQAESPTFSDHCEELTASEDESAKVDDEVPVEHETDNSLAKNSLMDDEKSESEGEGVAAVKMEPGLEQTLKANIPRPKSKKTEEVHNAEDVVLTADKTMNKELTLLHAPTVVKQEPADAALSGPSTRLRQKNPTKKSPKDRVKTEGDSSSDDEKREKWVNTKEKLLKRVQRTEDASIQDAKRAKLVNDFIVKRGGDAPDRKYRGRGRRSYKKFLEREKQLRVLSKELFGESSGDAIPGSKRSSAAPFKGRRNIRKVIDKKSLTRSTVLANMEEFERKRRLNIRQSRLRELMGCEEGVNVLVINDEVCLEYDFEENRPVVTVHPFFTKVMKAHQYEGVKFMWDACFESLEKLSSGHGGGGCILAHCMGLGKTLQVLALLHTVLTHPRVGMRRILVCCPLSTVLNWVDEIHKWIGPVTDQIKVFELSKLKKTYQRAYQLEDWYEGGGIFIIGYELFRSLSTLDPVLDGVRPAIVNKIRKALLDPGPDIIVCDEGHLLKNDASVLAVAMSRVVTKRRIVLTGTPMQNNLREYYCMVNFIKPNLLGTYSEYSNRFENPIMNGQHRDSSEDDIRLMKARTHILHKVLEGCLQRQEASVLYPYLPKKHEYTVFVPLTKCQWDLYKHYLNFYANDTRNSVLRDFHILQKIWSHPQVLHNFQTRRHDAMKNKVKVEKLEEEVQEELSVPMEHTGALDGWWLQYVGDGATLDDLATSNKFLVVFRILHECVQLGDKVLIFSTSLFCLDTLEFFLKKINKWALGHEYYRLDGSVPAEVRQKWCREFNAENNVVTKLFLISTRAGCLGLNMTGANRVIILDTSWNPAHDIQSIFRVYRFGQKKDCYIYRLVALGSMEQKIYERSVTKQAVACRVVDEQQIERHYNMAELTELYKFDEEGCNVAGGVAVGVSDVALLRVARDAPLHAVHEHDSLLRGSSEQGLPEHERAAAWMQFQQEHAHKQRQNEIDTERENMIKHMKTHDYVQMHTNNMAPNHFAVKVEPNNSPEAFSQPPEPKGKKGKRGVVKCTIPIQKAPQQATSSTAEEDPARKLKEDEIVKSIINIILRHNFHTTTQGPKEISNLVQSVRHIMQNGPAQFVNSSDELASSIANVLLQSGSCSQSNLERTAEPDPAPLQNPREPESTKDDVVGTPVAELSKYAEVVTERAQRPSTKRKSALIAEGRMESVVKEDSVNTPDDNDDYSQLVDDDYHGSDDGDYDSGDNQPLQQPERAKSPPRVVTGTKKKSKKEVRPPSPPAFRVYSGNSVANEVAKTTHSKNDFSDSIILSDDDDPPEVSKLPGPASQKKKKKTEDKKEIIVEKKEKELIEKETATAIDKTDGSGSEKVPLHPTLLLNPNFIKIVAHTYLSGNPMLAEDAAILAAQYSTSKAHREAAATGNPITSGPIYDIAVNVLGVSVLKKLHDNTAKIMLTKNSNDAREKLNKKNRSLLRSKSDAGKAVTPVSLTRAKDLASGKSQATEVNALKVVGSELSEDLPAASTSPRPVGLISRVQSEAPRAPNTASAGECILPDEEAPRAAPTVTRLPSGRLLFTPTAPRSAQLAASGPQHSTPPTANVLSASQLRVVAKTDTGRRIFATGTKQTLAASAVVESATICLDSDEETPEVVPVSLSINPAHPLAGVPDSNTVPPYPTAIAPYPTAFAPYPTAIAPYPTAVASYSTAAASPTTAATPAPDQTSGATSKCRPGDILRLTKSGKIEIVSRTGQLGSTTNAPLVAPKATRPAASDPRPAANTPAVPAKPPPTSTITPQSTVSHRSTSSSSSSSSDDPLSILKDVVHIQAANDAPSKTRLNHTPGAVQHGAGHVKPQEKFKFPPIAPRPGPSTARTNTKTVTASSPRATPPAATDKAKHKVESRDQNKPKEPILLNKTLTKSYVNKGVTKTKANVSATIDLTDTSIDVDRASNTRPATSILKAGARGNKVPDSKRTADIKKSAAPPRILNNTVSGTSRELLLDGKSIKLIPASPSIDLVESSNIIKIKEMKTITKSNGVLKRYSNVPDTSAPKKKKLSEMTLKDFDIDDIDDIIELE